eukprot:COSAG05_NODE_340_length_11109_cov_150.755041_2_plen_78_part_00
MRYYNWSHAHSVFEAEATTTTGHKFAQHAALFILRLRVLEDNVAMWTPKRWTRVLAKSVLGHISKTRLRQVYKLSKK